jgi:hypothetical protein
VKRLFIPLGLIAVMAVPGTAIGAPSKADKREGKRECRQLRDAAVTRANFVQIVKLEGPMASRATPGRMAGALPRPRIRTAPSPMPSSARRA